jgi:hypothetical protein
VIAVDCLVPAMLEAVALLLGSESLDIRGQGALVAFEREDAIGLTYSRFSQRCHAASHRNRWRPRSS